MVWYGIDVEPRRRLESSAITQSSVDLTQAETLLRKIELHRALPLADASPAVVIVHVALRGGVFGPAVRRCFGAGGARSLLVGVAVARLLGVDVASERVHAPRIGAFVRALRARLSLAVLLAAVAVARAASATRASAWLTVAVALAATRRTALRRRSLAPRHRRLDLDALAEHVVVAVLQHLLGAVIALESDETETTGLMVVRITHH